MPAFRRWVVYQDADIDMEYRVFPGFRVCVAVLRAARWGKVLYCEPGLSRNVRAIGPERIGDALSSFLKRAVGTGQTVDADRAFPDAAFAKDWPALFEYMTATKWPDGSDRKVSSVTLFAEDGSLKCCLNEKNDQCVLFAAGKTLKTCLNALEGLLAGSDTPWRKSSGGVATRAGKGQGRS